DLNCENGSSLLTCIRGDILDPDALEQAMDGCEIVFHTAAIADMDKARHMPVKTMEVNVMGTVRCLEAAKKAGVNRFLYASSAYTAGNRGSFYRVSKQTGESLCKTYAEEFGLKYTILRYGSLYGSESNQWNFLYGVCKALLTTGEFTYISSPNSEREYIHIRDASRETVRIATSDEFINKAVLITGHQRIMIRELFFMIQEILGKEIKIHYIPQEQQRHYVMTPYSFEADVPMRVNLSTYVDISEGILDCLRTVQDEIDQQNNSGSMKES
ncbi:NAD(P)-dependent oxidoreductase, partial [Methanoregula sp.]|uniref:NAD-dependent epimerase/dehydratase family protein n=1 Tax=Methanoregula sp. TaxID=2052170 RepID=UPI0025D86280